MLSRQAVSHRLSAVRGTELEFPSTDGNQYAHGSYALVVFRDETFTILTQVAISKFWTFQQHFSSIFLTRGPTRYWKGGTG